MRDFNKIFVIALPRCATVSMSQALGILGIPTAHLGHIYGEPAKEHYHPQRLTRIYQQICAGDFDLDILRQCRGLADYPVCCIEIIERLSLQYPDSLFINVRRDADLQGWIQSVERQFVGLQLLKQSRAATEQDQQFMQVMLALRKMTFGQSEFSAQVYLDAYRHYQSAVEKAFARRQSQLLQFEYIDDLRQNGFARLCEFLELPQCDQPFPNLNQHGLAPQAAFMRALQSGTIVSQTGLQAASIADVATLGEGASPT